MPTPAKPIILYDNILETGTVTATSEAGGFPLENCYDWRTYTLWKPTSTATQDIDIDAGSNTPVDAIAIIGHDLGTQSATLELFSDDNAGFTSATSLGTKSFSSDDPVYIDLTAANERYYRIRITLLDAVCFIGHIAIGQKMSMEVLPQDGYDVDAQQTRGKASTSSSGNFLGATVAFTERRVQAEFRYLTDTWVNSTLLPFLHTHYLQLKPFFFVPDINTLASRVYLLRAPDNPFVALQSESTYRHWTLAASGVRQSTF